MLDRTHNDIHKSNHQSNVIDNLVSLHHILESEKGIKAEIITMNKSFITGLNIYWDNLSKIIVCDARVVYYFLSFLTSIRWDFMIHKNEATSLHLAVDSGNKELVKELLNSSVCEKANVW
jgi:hypothetical protein